MLHAAISKAGLHAALAEALSHQRLRRALLADGCRLECWLFVSGGILSEECGVGTDHLCREATSTVLTAYRQFRREHDALGRAVAKGPLHRRMSRFAVAECRHRSV